MGVQPALLQLIMSQLVNSVQLDFKISKKSCFPGSHSHNYCSPSQTIQKNPQRRDEMEGLVPWGSKLHVCRSNMNLTKLSGMAKSCCLRHSQFFFNIVGTEVTWLGGVKFVLVLPLPCLASSGTSKTIAVPLECLSLGFSGFGPVPYLCKQ